MARKKSEPTKYVATTRRSEQGVGIVEKGEGVPLGEYLNAETIAHLIKNGFYAPEHMDPEVQAALDKLNDG